MSEPTITPSPGCDNCGGLRVEIYPCRVCNTSENIGYAALKRMHESADPDERAKALLVVNNRLLNLAEKDEATLRLLSKSVADLNVKLHALGGDEAFVEKLRDERIAELESMCAGSERRCATAELRAEVAEAKLAKAREALEQLINYTGNVYDTRGHESAVLKKHPGKACLAAGFCIQKHFDGKVAEARSALATIRDGDFELPKTLAGIAYKEKP